MDDQGDEAVEFGAGLPVIESTREARPWVVLVGTVGGNAVEVGFG